MTKFVGARRRLFVSGAVLALATAAFAPAALAQTEVGAPATGISEVIVTATKSATNLQKTPISISVISAPSPPPRF